MSRIAQTSNVQIILIKLCVVTYLILVASCSRPVSESKLDESTLTKTANTATTSVTTVKVAENEIENSTSELGLSPEDLEAVKGLIEEVFAASEAERAQAAGKLQVLFAAASKSPNKYRRSAKYVAQQIVERAPGKPVALHSNSFLVLTELIEHGASKSFFDRMSEFANAYPNNGRPLKLYRNLADKFVGDGDGRTALSLLNHGIKNCESDQCVAMLEKHKRLTTQTISLLARSSGSSRSSLGGFTTTNNSKTKATKTSPDSKHYAFIGKRVRPSGKTLEGRSLASNDLRGEWVYVHFWATWCGACRSGMSNVVDDYQTFSKQGVKFVGVNLDKDKSKAKKFAKSNGVSWPQLADRSLADSLEISSIPTSVLVSPEGKVVEAGSSSRMSKLISHQIGK